MAFTPIVPVTPIDFTDEELALGDRLEFLFKMNSQMAKLQAWTVLFASAITSINTRGAELEATQLSDASGIAANASDITDEINARIAAIQNLQAQITGLQSTIDIDELIRISGEADAIVTALASNPAIGAVTGLREELDALIAADALITPSTGYTAARALIGLTNGQRVRVNGKTVGYDYAQSDWVFSTSTVADNGGTVLAVTTGGHLRRIYEGPAIFDWFEGVESGGDVAFASLTDSTAGIQAALNAQLPSYAGVKGRHYKLTAKVTSKASVSIDGKGCTFKLGQTVFGLASGAIEIDTGHHKSTVKNIDFVGEHDMTWFLANTEWGHGDSCIYIRAATDVQVSGIRTTNRHRGIIAKNSINPSISDYKSIGFFPNYDDATYPIATAITNANYVYAVYIEGGEQASISKGRGSHMGSLVLVGDESQYASVTDIVGEDLQDNLVYMSSTDHSTVTHTSVKHTVGTGVKMRGSYNVAEHGYSENAGVGALISAYGAGGASTGSRISHFTALQPRSRGIYIDPGIGPISDASVTDCTVTGALDEAFVSLSVGRLTVRNVHSTGALSTDAAFIIYGIDASNLCNLTLDNCSASTGAKRGFLIQHAKGSVTRCSGVGNVNQLIEPRHCDGVSFQGNECKDQICIYMLDAAPNVNCLIGDQIGDPAGVVSTVYTQAANTAANMLTGNSRNLHTLSIPGIGAAPKAIGLKAYVGTSAYVSVGTASTADWKLITTQAAVADANDTIAAAAGTDAAVINALKTELHDLKDKLRTAGLIAT